MMIQNNRLLLKMMLIHPILLYDLLIYKYYLSA
jgi:hypothetical protein